MDVVSDKMIIEEIKKVLKENEKKKIIFSPEPEAIYYIWLEKDMLTFTSDNQDYLMAFKLEKAMEMLHKKFNLHNFNISIHLHPGNLSEDHISDKDVSFNIKDHEIDKVAEIIKFIMENFYLVKSWKYFVIK
jgi:hypothetical protein